MCNFPTIKDAANVAIATMLSGIQVGPYLQQPCSLIQSLFSFLKVLQILGVKGRAAG